MNSIALVGFLACVSFANADDISSFNSTTEEIRKILAEFDPSEISDISSNLIDPISLTVASASFSGFSDFAFSKLSDDGESVQLTFQLPKFSANVDSLVLSSNVGPSASLPSLDASVSGITFDINATYSSSPFRLSSISGLLQLSDVSVSGSVEFEGTSISISVASDIVDSINDSLSEAAVEGSILLLSITNAILSLIYPS